MLIKPEFTGVFRKNHEKWGNTNSASVNVRISFSTSWLWNSQKKRVYTPQRYRFQACCARAQTLFQIFQNLFDEYIKNARWPITEKELEVFDHQIHQKLPTDIIDVSFDAQGYGVSGCGHGSSVGSAIQSGATSNRKEPDIALLLATSSALSISWKRNTSEYYPWNGTIFEDFLTYQSSSELNSIKN